MSAPPLCFVHGLACGPEDWDGIVATLNPLQARSVANLGYFDPVAVEARAPTIASLARRVVVELQLMKAPAVLVGHSLGCRVIIEAAKQKPNAVAGLVFVDGSRLLFASPAALRATVEENPVAFVEDFFGQMMGPKMPAEMADHLVKRAKTMPADKLARLLEDGARWDNEDCEGALATLHDRPTMVLQSTVIDDDGRRRILQEGETMPWIGFISAQIPKARIEILAGLGHFSMIEDPEAVSRLLADFVAGLPAR